MYLLSSCFRCFGVRQGKCFRSFEGKKASAENPKTTDGSSEESEPTSEQTLEQTGASVRAEGHAGQTDIQKPVKKDILIAIDPGIKAGYVYERARAKCSWVR